MKKRLISTTLTLCLCVSMVPGAYALENQFTGGAPAAAEAVQSDADPCLTEETPGTAAGAATARDGTVYPTYDEAYEAMIALKSQYPEGMTWTNYEPYGNRGNRGTYYKWNGGVLKPDNINGGVGCAAFAMLLSDAAFGSLPGRKVIQGSFTYDSIKVGDILRVNNNSHFVIVLQKSDGGVIVAEGNYNKSVHWGRAISKADVEKSAFIVTRYPVGYKPNDGETDNEVVEDGTKDDPSWTLTKGGTLTITGNGPIPDYSPNDNRMPPWNEYKGGINTIVIGDGVTGIGNYAFYQSSALNVYLPEGITKIGNSAFRESRIVSITIPKNVATIGDDAFRECPNLTSVSTSEGLGTIGERAFHSCTSLGYIDFPRSLTKLGAGAFTSCNALEQVRFMPSTKALTLGANAFTECNHLKFVSLPEGITALPPEMFSSCSLVTYMYIPKSVTALAAAATNSPFQQTSIGTIYFGGTQTKWDSMMEAISKLGTAKTTYDMLKSANVVCEQSDPFVPDADDPGDIHFCENGKHAGPVENGICQNCDEAVNHTHSWSDSWSSNSKSHWHECRADNCYLTGNSGKDGYAAHVYDDGADTDCNTCGYTRTISSGEGPGHTHRWADEWSKDTAYHWHECTASDCTVTDNSQKGGYAAHVYDGDTDTTCNICGYTRTVSSGSSSFPGGGSSSNTNTTITTTKNPDGSTTTKTENKTTGTTTETTKSPDGSVNVVETKKDGTVTTTETDKSGNKTETVANPDGSSSITAVRKDGTTASVTTSASGQTEAEVTLPTATVSEAQRSGEAIPLPIQGVRATQNTASAPVVTVKTGSTEPVKVEIPTENVTPGTVAMIVHADGSGEVIKTTVPTESGIAVSLPDGATVKIVDNSKSFADVPAAHWAGDAINFTSARELFSGTAAATFTPDAPMTRAMLMTVLARCAGEDSSGGAVWYEKGMEWAVAHAISDGSNPNGIISREQLVVMLWRYSGSPAANRTLSAFTDAGEISGYAQEAMCWAVEKGIISGYGNGQLTPKGQATRAETATIIMRYSSGT